MHMPIEPKNMSNSIENVHELTEVSPAYLAGGGPGLLIDGQAFGKTSRED